MKQKLVYFIACIALFSFYFSCEDMNEKTKEYYGEIVYPAKYDTIVSHIGYERVELDLLKAGRIPSNEINMGKAKKTIIEYDDQEIVLNELVSWVDVTGLTQSKIYRFYVYTEDEYGNRSVPQEIAPIPFTSSDLEALTITTPRLTTSPSSAVVEWPAGLSSMLYNFEGMEYEFTDRNGNKVTGELGKDDTRFFAGNLVTGAPTTVLMKAQIVPLVNGESILDTVTLVQNFTINVPTNDGSFSPAERNILIKNGITDFGFASVSTVEKLIFPLTTASFSDLFFFSNLKELDLTGAGLPGIVPELLLSGNGYSKTVGGCDWQPYLRRIEYTEVLKPDPEIASQQTLIDLLESGILKKVTYIKNSMGLDDVLAPYIESGVVELVPDTWFPKEIVIDPSFLHAGQLQTSGFQVDMTFPASSSEVPGGLANTDNVLKVVPQAGSATFAYSLPGQYMYDFERYRYLKFKVYVKGDDASIDTDLKTGSLANYKAIWPRIRYTFWGNDNPNNPYGNGDDWEWKPSDRNQYAIPEANVGAAWTEITIDMKQVVDKIKGQEHDAKFNPRSGHYHSRNICFSLGGEQGGFDSDKPFTYYFADVRMSQTP